MRIIFIIRREKWHAPADSRLFKCFGFAKGFEVHSIVSQEQLQVVRLQYSVTNIHNSDLNVNKSYGSSSVSVEQIAYDTLNVHS